ncbi:transmembrane protein 154 [Cebidichthys violaceus]|uniref:transmembrane protein 154 n=1 Tax=Cebidichthys violaceus TaxID=271503 RepID=UPI0035CB580E
MFASGTGSMRGPWMKTPLLLLLLLLLTTLNGTVLCEEENDGTDTDTPDEEAVDAEPGDTEEAISTSESPTANYIDNTSEDDQGSGTPEPTVDSNCTGTTEAPKQDMLNSIIILIPVVLVVIIIGMIVCGIFINRRWNEKMRNQELRKEDPYLDGSSAEKVPMPMFEDDVPSVLELEMEELGQWMKKDGEPTEDFKHA